MARRPSPPRAPGPGARPDPLPLLGPLALAGLALAGAACGAGEAAPDRPIGPPIGPPAAIRASEPPARPGAPATTPASARRPAAGAEPPAGTAARVAGAVSEARAQRRVRELVALGSRMGGTRSGLEAARYCTEAFRAAGLATRVLADTAKWCHEASSWEVRARTAAGEALELASAWPLGFSPARTGGAADVELALSLEPRAGGAWLTERVPPRDVEPAPAVVLVDGETTRDGTYPRLGDLAAGPDAPFPVFGLSRGDGERLRAALERGGVRMRARLETRIVRSRPLTALAVLAPRAGAPPGHLLFCAHGDSDSGGPGANDNASGEAIVLEIATAWAEAVRTGALPPPAREVRFAIWGSEIHSTRDYLARCERAGEEVLAVINFDQAGFGSGADQLDVEPDDLPSNASLIAALLEVLEENEGAPGFPERWATNRSLGGTDSYVFSGSERFRAEGRPAVTLFASAWGEPDEQPRTPGMPGESWTDRDLVRIDYDVHYHSSGDTPENTTDREPWNMGWCARVGLLGAHRWLEGLSGNEATSP